MCRPWYLLFPRCIFKMSNYIRDHCILSGFTNNLTRRKLTAIFVTFSKNKYRENKKLVQGNGFPRFLIFFRSSDFNAKKPICFFCVCVEVNRLNSFFAVKTWWLNNIVKTSHRKAFRQTGRFSDWLNYSLWQSVLETRRQGVLSDLKAAT